MAGFEGKVALVTGGGSGIGRASALAFARVGARVMVTDLDGASADETARMIGAEARSMAVDVAVPSQIEAMVSEAVRAFGRLDVALNNAGMPGRYTDVVDCTEEEWDRVGAVNLKSVWLCMKHEIPAMLASGGGAIVNMASQAVFSPPPRMASYITTKAGVVALTKSAALDFGGQGIRVNAVLPGPTLTPMMRPENVGKVATRLPLGRIGQPEDQAQAVLWLASDAASFVTGVALSVDGGLGLT